MKTVSEVFKILVVDDHPLFIESLIRVLTGMFPKASIFTANTSQQAVVLSNQHQDLDCILLDYHLPDGDGLSFMAKLNQAMIAVPIIFITANDDLALINRCMELGANGFIPKSAASNIYFDCIQEVIKGGDYLPTELLAPLKHFREYAKSQLSPFKLSPRQRDVLVMLTEGYSNRDIATSLNISENTVKSYVSTLIETFGVKNRSECVAESRRYNLIN